MKSPTAAALLCIVLAACAPGPGYEAIVVLGADEPEVIEESELILRARARDVSSSRFSPVETEISGSSVHLRFGSTSSREHIEYLLGTRGALTAMGPGPDGPTIWYTEQDIVDVSAAFSQFDEPVLNIRLSDAAGDRLLALTRESVGQRITTRLDEELLSEAVIRGVFGGQFQATGFSADQAVALATILRLGRLPAPVLRVDVSNSEATE